MPKVGFSNTAHKREMTVLQLGRLAEFVEKGRLVPEFGRITMKELLDSGAVHNVKEGGVKLLGDVRLVASWRKGTRARS